MGRDSRSATEAGPERRADEARELPRATGRQAQRPPDAQEVAVDEVPRAPARLGAPQWVQMRPAEQLAPLDESELVNWLALPRPASRHAARKLEALQKLMVTPGPEQTQPAEQQALPLTELSRAAGLQPEPLPLVVPRQEAQQARPPSVSSAPLLPQLP